MDMADMNQNYPNSVNLAEDYPNGNIAGDPRGNLRDSIARNRLPGQQGQFQNYRGVDVPKTRPVPHPDHVDAAEQEAAHKRAVNHIMLRDNLSWPEATHKLEREGGYGTLLAQLDAPAPMSDDAVRAALKARLTHSPQALLDFVIELADRVLHLEGSPDEVQPQGFGQPDDGIDRTGALEARRTFTDAHTTGPKPFGQAGNMPPGSGDFYRNDAPGTFTQAETTNEQADYDPTVKTDV
jgi:hypothetical protein